MMQFETQELKNKVVKTKGLKMCLTLFLFFPKSIFFNICSFLIVLLFYFICNRADMD